MKTPTRPTRRLKVNSPRAELNYLSELISYYVHPAINGRVPKRVHHRFRTMLEEVGDDDGSIKLQEHWVLLCHLEGDPAGEIRHCRREVQLIKRAIKLERALKLSRPIGCFTPTYLASRIKSLDRLCENKGRKSASSKLR